MKACRRTAPFLLLSGLLVSVGACGNLTAGGIGEAVEECRQCGGNGAPWNAHPDAPRGAVACQVEIGELGECPVSGENGVRAVGEPSCGCVVADDRSDDGSAVGDDLELRGEGAGRVGSAQGGELA